MKKLAGICAVIVLAAVACNSQRYGNDYVSQKDGSGNVLYAEVRDDANMPLCSGNPCGYDGIKHIYNDAQNNCVANSMGSWGTVGSSTDLPDATLIACFRAQQEDDPGDSGDPYSVVCGDTNTANDCKDPDGTGSYQVLTNDSAYYRDRIAGSDARALATLKAARDWSSVMVTESGHSDYPDCLKLSATGNPVPGLICLQ